jgi:hypothetical protein
MTKFSNGGAAERTVRRPRKHRAKSSRVRRTWYVEVTTMTEAQPCSAAQRASPCVLYGSGLKQRTRGRPQRRFARSQVGSRPSEIASVVAAPFSHNRSPSSSRCPRPPERTTIASAFGGSGSSSGKTNRYAVAAPNSRRAASRTSFSAPSPAPRPRAPRARERPKDGRGRAPSCRSARSRDPGSR